MISYKIITVSNFRFNSGSKKLTETFEKHLKTAEYSSVKKTFQVIH